MTRVPSMPESGWWSCTHGAKLLCIPGACVRLASLWSVSSLISSPFQADPNDIPHWCKKEKYTLAFHKTGIIRTTASTSHTFQSVNSLRQFFQGTECSDYRPTSPALLSAPLATGLVKGTGVLVYLGHNTLSVLVLGLKQWPRMLTLFMPCWVQVGKQNSPWIIGIRVEEKDQVAVFPGRARHISRWEFPRPKAGCRSRYFTECNFT